MRLALGDFEGYRKACEDLLERFGQTDDLHTANVVAWTLTVVPNATIEFDFHPCGWLRKRSPAIRRTSPTSVRSGRPLPRRPV